jgi:hypothetical protein
MLSAEPVCSCAYLFAHIAHETAGAARTRSSLRPLFLEGGMFLQNSGAWCRENGDACSVVVVRLDRTIQYSEALVMESKRHSVLDTRFRGYDGRL